MRPAGWGRCLTEISLFDGMLTACALVVSVRAAARGFLTEAFGLAAVVAGVGVAVIFAGRLGRYIDSQLGESVWNQVLGFLGLFLIVYAGLKVVETVLHRVFNTLRLQKLDHVLGLLLGLAEGVVIAVVLIVALEAQPLIDVTGLLSGSVVADLIHRFVPR